MQAANYLASKRGKPELTPLHLLASLLADREGVVVPILSRTGVDSQSALAEARHCIDSLAALWAGGALKAEPSSDKRPAFGADEKTAGRDFSTSSLIV